jgi:hypothetical protein
MCINIAFKTVGSTKYMNKLRILSVVPAVLAMGLILSHTKLADAQPVPINANFQPDPLVLNGTSGGANKGNCGNVAATPNHVLEVKKSLPYLRLTVEGQGQPTLLIDGPGGRFCVLTDNSGSKPEISGYWQEGKYSLYVGDLSQKQFNYTLSISQQKK